VVLLGVLPSLLGTLSEHTTEAMARVPGILRALAVQGVG
jgi:hypothetical protein